MPKYKKAKRRHKSLFKQRDDIYMKSEDSVSDDNASSFKIIKGKKERIRKRNLIIAGVSFLIAVVIFLISVLSPTGIVEGFNNYFSGFSLRSYFPSAFDGNELYGLSIKGKHFYTLSNQTLSSYNLNGKKLFEEHHGFEKPVVALSQTRALIYDQSGTALAVFNSKSKILSLDTEFSIYSADICRNGYFAVATKAQSYTSAVTVYDDEGNFVYEWSSPEEIVTSVALSSDGEKIAVSAVKSQNGTYFSSVYVFNYNSVEPVFEQTYENVFVSSLISDFNKYFCVVSQNKCDFVNWKDFSVTSYTTENDIKMIRNDSKNTIICEPHSSDDSSNAFTVFNRKHEQALKYEFLGYVDDYAFVKNNLYVLSGNDVYCINKKGETIKTTQCTFGTVKIVPVSTHSVIAVSDNSLTEVSFN